MIPSHYSLVGHYASLARRLEKISGGTAADKKARAAAMTALKTKQEALIAAHRKLSDALEDYEAASAEAVSGANRALSSLRSTTLPAAAERPVEAAMHAGAHHLDEIHHLFGDGLGDSAIVTVASPTNRISGCEPLPGPGPGRKHRSRG